MRKTLPRLIILTLILAFALLPIRAYADDSSTQDEDACYWETQITVARPEIGKTPATTASAKAYYGEYYWDHDQSDNLTFLSLSWEERADSTGSWKKMTTSTFREGYYYKAVLSFRSTNREFFVSYEDNYPTAAQYPWNRLTGYDNYYYEECEGEASSISRDATSALRLYTQELTFPRLSKISTGYTKSIKMTVNQSMTEAQVGKLLNVRVNGSAVSVKTGSLSKGDYYVKDFYLTTSDKKKVSVRQNYLDGGVELDTFGASKGKCTITVTARLYRATANDKDTGSKSKGNPESYGTLTWKIPAQVTYSSNSPQLRSYKLTSSKKTFKVTLQNASARTITMKKGTYTAKNSGNARKNLTVRLKKDVSIKSGKKATITYQVIKGTYAAGIAYSYEIQAKMKWNGKTGTIGLREVWEEDAKDGAYLTFKAGSKKYKVYAGLQPYKYNDESGD